MVKIENMKPEVLEIVLKFIYTINLDDMSVRWKPQRAGGILKAAKRFGLPKLQKQCLLKLVSELSLENVGSFAVFGLRALCSGKDYG